MKAWEIERSLRDSAVPPDNHSPQWGFTSDISNMNNVLLKSLWRSYVPGSGAPEHLIVGAVQSVENMGRDVTAAEGLLRRGFDALDKNDLPALKGITSRIFHLLETAPVIERHPYHAYRRPLSWKDISTEFPKKGWKLKPDLIEDKVRAGWLGQIAGASMGTAIEGYTHERLVAKYGGQLGRYIREPDTENDDVTYEIAFLMAFEEKMNALTSEDIALKWVSYIPFGWSAELVALSNLKMGLFPPHSGRHCNPFQEWIGAQMRCMVEGLVSPGMPYDAARLAYLDSIISHSGNGVYGGIHSAVLTSLAFVYDDPRKIVEESLYYIPSSTEFFSVVSDAIRWCKEASDWLDVYRMVKERFKKYNWIHLYPNTAAVITALWFAEGDFDSSMKVIASFGYDVDCNAGEVGTVIGVLGGMDGIDKSWYEPFGGYIKTYMEDMERISIEDFLVRKSLKSIW